MKVRSHSRLLGIIGVMALLVVACGEGGEGASTTTTAQVEPTTTVAAPGDGDDSDTETSIEVVRGVDPESGVIRVGSLFDLSGPLAILGVPWHASVVAGIEQLNESGTLGDWTVELVVRDHGYNPSDSVAMYEEIKDDVIMLAPSLGTSTTAAILPRLADDNMLAFIGGGATSSLSDYSMWGFSSYRSEAMRVFDHAVETGGSDVVIGIIHPDEDAGADASAGFHAASEALGVEIAEQVIVEITTDEWTAAIGRLQDAGATHVCICISAGHAGGILGTAASMGYEPQWYGMLPTFLEPVFYGALPPEVWEDNFLWVHGLPFWGEDRPGMAEFVAAYEASSAAEQFPAPQFWALVGYLQVQQLGAILHTAIEAGDLSPDGIRSATQSVTDFDAGGLLLGPVDLLSDGEATKVTRVLAPDIANQSWTVIGEEKELDW